MSSNLENVFIIGTGESKVQKKLKASLWNMSIKKFTASSSFERLRKMSELDKVDLIVIEDTDDAPLPIQLREILNHPLTCMIPTILFTSPRHNLELKLTSDLEYIFAIEADSTHDDIQSSFAPISALTSNESFKAKRAIIFNYSVSGPAGAMQTALQLCKGSNMLGSIGPSLSGLLVEQGKNDEAEKILRSALKMNSNVLGNLLALVNVLMQTSKPDEAHKIAENLCIQYPEAMLPKLDRLATEVMCDRVADIEQSLISLTTYKPLSEHATFALMKLYLATHRPEKTRSLGFDSEFLSHIQSRWMGLEDRLKKTG